MTKGAPSDDFFGIEYVSSSYTSPEPDKERSQPEEAPRSSKDGPKQLAGSKYLDEAFFPEIMERSSKENELEEKPRNSKTDFVDKFSQYFSGLDEKEKRRFSDEFYEKIGQKSELKQEISTDKSHHELFYDNISRQKEKNVEDASSIAQKYLERRQKGQEKSLKSASEPKRHDKRKRRKFETSEEKEKPATSIQAIRFAIPAVWNFSQDLLVDYLANRIIFQNSNLIAFDKPYALPYSGSDKHNNQFDRLLQVLKARVAPKVERLHLVRSLDTRQSGIILFATSALAQTEAQDQLKKGTLTHRCLVKGILDEPIDVTIPLVQKLTRNRGKPDFKLVPLFTNQTQNKISHGTTLLKPLASTDGISYIEAETKNEVSHQLRCHLSLAKLALFDDNKYGRTDHTQNIKLPKPFLNRLELTETQGRKLPMLSHLRQMRLPSDNLQKPEIVIRAPLPPHFTWFLQKLRFLKR